MTWTKTPPTEPGWYLRCLMRGGKSLGIHLAAVELIDGDLCRWNPKPYNRPVPVAISPKGHVALWIGPIPLPGDNK
jgi:hypothetical protein